MLPICFHAWSTNSKNLFIPLPKRLRHIIEERVFLNSAKILTIKNYFTIWGSKQDDPSWIHFAICKTGNIIFINSNHNRSYNNLLNITTESTDFKVIGGKSKYKVPTLKHIETPSLWVHITLRKFFVYLRSGTTSNSGNYFQ